MAALAVTRRFDLTDAQWARLEPLLPTPKGPGRPSRWTKRQLIDGIRWRVRVGAPRRDVPRVLRHLARKCETRDPRVPTATGSDSLVQTAPSDGAVVAGGRDRGGLTRGVSQEGVSPEYGRSGPSGVSLAVDIVSGHRGWHEACLDRLTGALIAGDCRAVAGPGRDMGAGECGRCDPG
ncbi:transposase [Nonomuraea sp. NPDC055795]